MKKEEHRPRLRHSPWAWVPTLYFAEAVPYVAVMSLSVMMYKRLNLSNADIAFYTSWLYLPWVIKPFWSPLVDLLKTKRWWTVAMELLIGASLACVAWSLPTGSHFLRLSLAFFWLMAFSSATHDIAADGYYMQELNSHEQSLYVGIRSTFYRLGTIVGQGALVMLAGELEVFTRRVAYAWSLTFYALAGLYLLFTVYHQLVLPHPEAEEPGTRTSLKTFATDFLFTFYRFFKKPQALVAVLFLLLYRLPEALLVKMTDLFLIDPVSAGGLGLSTLEVGWVKGTVGVIGLTLGGILGGVAVSMHGLKRWLWPMVWSITLPDLVYVYLSLTQTSAIPIVSLCLFVEQFGYGFGFTAYMLYMIYYARGKHQTAHYAFCTGLMALSMMLPGMVAGALQEWMGYSNFFLAVIACCVLTVWVASLLRIDATFGIKKHG